MKLSLVQLREQAEQLRRQGEDLSALRLYIAVLERTPEDHDTRMHLADALSRGKATQRAVRVYEAVARQCLHVGRPLVAIVALRAIEALGTATGEQLAQLARAYGKSEGPPPRRVTRPTVPHNEPGVDARLLRRELTVEQLLEQAERVGTDLGFLEQQPPFHRRIPLLSEVTPDRLVRVIRTALVHRLPAGHVLFRQGDAGQSCFLVANGSVSVRARQADGSDEEVAALADGAIFGEMSLITGAPRSATVVATEEIDLLELGPESLAAMGDELTRVASSLDRLAGKRWMSNLVRQSPVFQAFSEEERAELLKHFQSLVVPAGTVLWEQGQPVQGIYLVARGEVGFLERGAGEPVMRQRHGPGSTLGLDMVLDSAPAPVAAATLSPATVLFLSASSVTRLVEAVPEFAQAIRGAAPR